MVCVFGLVLSCNNVASSPGSLEGGAREEEKESLVQTDCKSAHCVQHNHVGSFSTIRVNVISCG